MKILLYLIIFIIIASCSTNKGVYWCGDHACINKKEKEAYFKKTMIVEIKEISKNTEKNKTETEKIIQQAKLEEKRRIKEEKDLAKQAKLEEKRIIKEEKDLAEKVQKDEKKIIKKEKKLSKHSVKTETNTKDTIINISSFEKLVEKITKRNSVRPYPEINDIPN